MTDERRHDPVTTAFLLVEVTRGGEPVWAVKWRSADGTRPKRRIGVHAWLERNGSGGWQPRVGRPHPGYATERQARRRVVPKAKAGFGSAVNDTTRLLGGTLGVAVIGSVFASLYASRLTTALPAGLPANLTHTAHASVGAALTVADGVGHTGHPTLAAGIHNAATSAFFHGFSAANFVAAGVAFAGALMALALLPAHPAARHDDTHDPLTVASPAAAAATS